MKEEVFYKRSKEGYCADHLFGHCHIVSLAPTDFYCVPRLNLTITSEHDSKGWNLLNCKIITKDAVRTEIDEENLNRVMEIYHEIKIAEKKELEKIFDYKKKNNGKLLDGKKHSEIFSESDDLRRKFELACEKTFVPPQI